jgi:hypothetical protein
MLFGRKYGVISQSGTMRESNWVKLLIKLKSNEETGMLQAADLMGISGQLKA